MAGALISRRKGSGTRLIAALAAQIGGQIKRESSKKGTTRHSPVYPPSPERLLLGQDPFLHPDLGAPEGFMLWEYSIIMGQTVGTATLVPPRTRPRTSRYGKWMARAATLPMSP